MSLREGRVARKYRKRRRGGGLGGRVSASTCLILFPAGGSGDPRAQSAHRRPPDSLLQAARAKPGRQRRPRPREPAGLGPGRRRSTSGRRADGPPGELGCQGERGRLPQLGLSFASALKPSRPTYPHGAGAASGFLTGPGDSRCGCGPSVRSVTTPTRSHTHTHRSGNRSVRTDLSRGFGLHRDVHSWLAEERPPDLNVLRLLLHAELQL